MPVVGSDVSCSWRLKFDGAENAARLWAVGSKAVGAKKSSPSCPRPPGEVLVTETAPGPPAKIGTSTLPDASVDAVSVVGPDEELNVAPLIESSTGRPLTALDVPGNSALT